MYGRKITAAAIQMSSTLEKAENLEAAERLIREAVAAEAALVALPELWSCHGLEQVYGENAESIPGPTTDFLGGLACELGVYLIGGSLTLPISPMPNGPAWSRIYPPPKPPGDRESTWSLG